MNLSDLKKGDKGIIEKVGCSGELKKRLLDMGIVKGAEVKVEKIAPLGDPIEITVKGYRLSVRKTEAKEIMIKE